MIDLAQIDLQAGLPSDDAAPTVGLKREDGTWKSLYEIVQEAAAIIIEAHGQNRSEAARVLDVGRSTLYRRFISRRPLPPQIS